MSKDIYCIILFLFNISKKYNIEYHKRSKMPPKKKKQMKPVDFTNERHPQQHDVIKVVDKDKRVDEKDVFDKPKVAKVKKVKKVKKS
jgi:hypothetical protein|tara:strand:- start:499 stop:759 length:261 start_codon:yes stop_codon:yes gene_type:complete